MSLALHTAKYMCMRATAGRMNSKNSLRIAKQWHTHQFNRPGKILTILSLVQRENGSFSAHSVTTTLAEYK